MKNKIKRICEYFVLTGFIAIFLLQGYVIGRKLLEHKISELEERIQELESYNRELEDQLDWFGPGTFGIDGIDYMDDNIDETDVSNSYE